MLNRWIERRVERFERAFGYDASYMKEILRASRRAFLRVARLQGMSRHREDVPLDAYYAVKLVTAVHEDCGPCTQLVADLAVADGLAPDTVRALVAGQEQALSDDARLGV